jgi:hypothetical protein
MIEQNLRRVEFTTVTVSSPWPGGFGEKSKWDSSQS